MNKRFAGVLAALLVLLMGTTSVFAATGTPSPNSQAALKQKANDMANKVSTASATTDAGASVSLQKGTISTDNLTAANELANQKGSGSEMLAAVEITTNVSADVIAKGITVKLSIPNISANDNVYVLHKKSDGTWETLKPSSIGAGYLSVKLYSLSPVVVVRYPAGTSVATSQQTPASNTETNNTDSNNTSTTGDTQTNTQTNSQTDNQTNSQSQSNNQDQDQTNNNNQSNSQSNNQNNPVNVTQNVTVNYPEKDDSYDEGYDEGYDDGYDAGVNANKGNGSTGTNAGTGNKVVAANGSVVLSPKTGASLPVLPFAAMFAFAGMAACGKKARKSN